MHDNSLLLRLVQFCTFVCEKVGQGISRWFLYQLLVQKANLVVSLPSESVDVTLA